MSEKQFEPSPEKLKKALIQGKTKRSQLLASTILLLLVVFGIRQGISVYWVRIQMLLECYWSNPCGYSGECGGAVVTGAYSIVTISLLLIVALAVLIQWMQVGTLWLPAVLLPDLKRISPAQGFLKVTSGLQRAALLLAKCIAAGLILFALSAYYVSEILLLGQLYPEQQWQFAGTLLGSFAVSASSLMLGFALIDLFEQRRNFRQQVFLDHQELKRQSRESDGDPYLRAHRRALHQALSREQQIEQIKRATVIIVERADASLSHAAICNQEKQ